MDMTLQLHTIKLKIPMKKTTTLYFIFPGLCLLFVPLHTAKLFKYVYFVQVHKTFNFTQVAEAFDDNECQFQEQIYICRAKY